MVKVAIIGGGIFGCCAAIELKKKGFEVVLFERSNDLLSGASTNNHLRHHHGYHYPRSKDTALESIKSREDFESEFRECIIGDYPAYYAVAKENSKSTPEQFLKFCDDLKLEYELVEIDKNIFNPDLISICVKTPEQAYDPLILKNLVEKRFEKNKIDHRLRNEVIAGKTNGKVKTLTIRNGSEVYHEDFDFVVSAIYSNFNKINEWFGFEKKTFQYDLMELIDVRLPIKERIAAMIVDGDFSTFVPLQEKGVVRLGHSKHVFLKTLVTDDIDTDSLIKENKITHKDKILSESAKYYPLLKNAKYLGSTFIVRVIKSNVQKTDERPSEVTSHGNGIYSIFGGKVITSVSTAKNLANMIMREVN